jgi:DNA-binding transcriptional regulator/RsmH inhibitor MraZ
MFFGTYTAQIDKQKRIRIPSDFRRIIIEKQDPEKDTVYLKAFDGGIEIYPFWEMTNIYKEFMDKSILDAETRDEMNEIARNFYRTKLDLANGRLKVPDDLFKGFEIGQEVSIQGGGRFIRVRAT